MDSSSAADARGAIFEGYEFGGFRAPPCSVVEWKKGAWVNSIPAKDASENLKPFLLASAKKKRAHPAPIPSPISDDWSSEE